MRVFKTIGRLLLLLTGVSLGATLAAALASGVAAAVLKPRLPSRAQPDDDEIELVAVYGEARLRLTSTAFRGGRVICWYAGMDLDLRAASLDPAGGDLVVWTIFGGTRIRVPEDWRVQSHGIAIFGGASSAAPRPEAGFDGSVLRVRHRTVFGGFRVAGEPDDEFLAV